MCRPQYWKQGNSLRAECECHDRYDNYGMYGRNSSNMREDGTEEMKIVRKRMRLIGPMMIMMMIKKKKKTKQPRKLNRLTMGLIKKERRNLNRCREGWTQLRSITYVNLASMHQICRSHFCKAYLIALSPITCHRPLEGNICQCIRFGITKHRSQWAAKRISLCGRERRWPR